MHFFDHCSWHWPCDMCVYKRMSQNSFSCQARKIRDSTTMLLKHWREVSLFNTPLKVTSYCVFTFWGSHTVPAIASSVLGLTLVTIFCRTTGPGEESGFGFELTFRLKAHEDENTPPMWPATLLNSLAKYVFKTGRWWLKRVFTRCTDVNLLIEQMSEIGLLTLSTMKLQYVFTCKVSFVGQISRNKWGVALYMHNSNQWWFSERLPVHTK